MTINELFSGGGAVGALLVAMTLIEITPIKINPWSKIGKAIGKCINGDVIEKLDETRKTLDDHIRTDNARNADMHRAAILRFNNELLRDIPHTREEFIEALSAIDSYERYCGDHPEYKNNRAKHAVANIQRVYDERLVKRDFL